MLSIIHKPMRYSYCSHVTQPTSLKHLFTYITQYTVPP